MSTPKQIDANRRNAQKSSGPRSAAGKAASSANSLKTGLYARSQVIAGEDPAELRALADQYFLRWQPATPEESCLVATLIDSDWLLRRYSLADAKIWVQIYLTYLLLAAILVVGVTGWLLCTRLVIWQFPIADCIERETRSCVEVNKGMGISFPSTISYPMESELVPIYHLSEHRYIRLASQQIANFGLREILDLPYSFKWDLNPIGNVWVHESNPNHIVHFIGKKRRSVFIFDHFGETLYHYLKGDTLTNIDNDYRNHFKFHVARYGFEERRCDFQQGALVNLEVMAQIMPLKVGYNGIRNGEWNGDALQNRLPPIKGLIPGIIGLLGIAWGWWNLRMERRFPASGIVFVIGVTLWGYACTVLLLWSVE